MYIIKNIIQRIMITWAERRILRNKIGVGQRLQQPFELSFFVLISQSMRGFCYQGLDQSDVFPKGIFGMEFVHTIKVKEDGVNKDLTMRSYFSLLWWSIKIQNEAFP
jgi:hypothetical protein